MTTGTLNRRTVVLLVLGIVFVLILRFGVYGEKEPVVVTAADTVEMAERRLEKLRQLASTVPAREAMLKQAAAETAEEEKSILQVDSAAQAQAQLLQIVRRVAEAEGIDLRGSEFGQPRPLGADYGEVMVIASFDCRIEQLVNFLAALANQKEMLATNAIHLNSGNPKEKTVGARIEVSGVVPKKLVPEKRGFSPL